MRYFAKLTTGRIVLWCYLIWYLFFVTRYFDPSLELWFTSLGLSGIIGFALMISTWRGKDAIQNWQIFRLFLMPFCVSSFAALVKGRGFILVFSSRLGENLLALGCCAAFCAGVAALKFARRRLRASPR